MDQFEVTRPGSEGKGRKSPEESRLDSLLSLPDPLLTASLQEQEGDLRRRRWLWRLPVALLLALALVFTSSTWDSPALFGAEDPASSENARADALVFLEQAQRLAYENQWEKAHTLFLWAVRLAPDLPDVWAGLAMEHYNRYQIGDAEQAARRCLALDSGHPTALQILGWIHLGLGETRKAEELWAKPGLERDLAQLYLRDGRFDEAKRLLAPLLRAEPDDEELRRLEAAASSRSLDPTLKAHLGIRPTSRSRWTALGWRLHTAQQYEEAVPAFERALTEDPGDMIALNGMGHTLLELRRAHEARVYFERALKIAPENPVAWGGLGSALKAEGKVDEAIQVWEAMSQLYPGPNRGTKGLAWTYYERGDYRRAARYLAMLVKRYPNDERLVQALNISVQKIDESSP
ncbi:MAG TPA: tetratricopeptide repeat protein [Thermoanaerobaculia bacterium]|nr:tetratricopeptide repeat protein [Thermoanaerobaculia bacterium]